VRLKRRVLTRWALVSVALRRGARVNRARTSFFAARRSWWRAVLESESLHVLAGRLVRWLARWALSGRGAGPVGVALGAAGTQLLLLEGPTGVGLTGGNGTLA